MKYILGFIILLSHFLFAQKNFSDKWQDLYSYNNVKDFTIVGNKIYAVCENVLFIYNINSKKTQKFSSVNGLSGGKISSVSYDEVSDSVILGYENGLIEVVSAKEKITAITGIEDNLLLTDKVVRGMYKQDGFSYIYGEFGIVELNIEDFELVDSYNLSTGSKPKKVRKIIIEQGVLYAATESGLYSIVVSGKEALNPERFYNWKEIVNGNISDVVSINNKVLYSIEKNIYSSNNIVTPVISEKDNIENIDTYDSTIVVTTNTKVSQYDTSYIKKQEINLTLSRSHTFTTSKAVFFEEKVYIQTSQFGILVNSFENLSGYNYEEIHPAGPTRNDAFAITVKNNQQWIVYGGFEKSGYNGLIKFAGIDFFDGDLWSTRTYKEIGSSRDCTRAILDPFDNSKLLVGTYLRGVLEFNDFNYEKNWGAFNTSSILPGHNEVPISNLTENWVADILVDNNKMVWVGNSRAKENKIFTMYDGRETGVNRWVQNVKFPKMDYNGGVIKGLNKMFVDNNNNIFAGTKENGLLVFNADPVNNEKERNLTVLNNLPGKGQLPSNKVLSVVADENGKVWIGTALGLVVFDDYDNLFSRNRRPAKKIIIEEVIDDEIEVKELLGSNKINDIIIDHIGDKWIATENAGVFHLTSDGLKTIDIFNVQNSPLPTNRILDLELDKSEGIIYIVTDQGVLSYQGADFFADKITSIVAYPNPSIRDKAGHEEITIVSKDGRGIPKDTNVKILDVSGKLVFESNLSKERNIRGGRFVWDKRNLNGVLVASGVYIVLFSSPDGAENTMTKIAIVN